MSNLVARGIKLKEIGEDHLGQGTSFVLRYEWIFLKRGLHGKKFCMLSSQLLMYTNTFCSLRSELRNKILVYVFFRVRKLPRNELMHMALVCMHCLTYSF